MVQTECQILTILWTYKYVQKNKQKKFLITSANSLHWLRSTNLKMTQIRN